MLNTKYYKTVMGERTNSVMFLANNTAGRMHLRAVVNNKAFILQKVHRIYDILLQYPIASFFFLHTNSSVTRGNGIMQIQPLTNHRYERETVTSPPTKMC